MRRIKGTVRLALLVAALIMAAGGPVAAATRAWTGAAGTSWFLGLNWTPVPSGPPELPPYPFDDLIINSGVPCAGSLVTTDGGGSIIFQGSMTSGTFDGGLCIGDTGNGYLGIFDSALITNTSCDIGQQVGSTGTATVHSATWTSSGSLLVGRGGSGALNILNGAQVGSASGAIGYYAGSTGTVTVDNGTWSNSGPLHVGDYGIGELSVSNGGEVTNSYGYIGYGGGSTGTVTVDNGIWTNSSSLYVGRGGSGALSISNGGQVANTHGYIACYAGSTSTATVEGLGSSWTISGSLHVAGSSASGAGGTGSLTVSNGGEVNVGNTLKVWGTGTVDLKAGGLIVADEVENACKNLNETYGNIDYEKIGETTHMLNMADPDSRPLIEIRQLEITVSAL